MSPILRAAPRVLVTHLETCRPDTVFYAGMVSVAGALLADPDPATWRVVAAWTVATLGWVASLYGGDWFDRELDAVAKPGRPIPSGRMRPGTAFAGMVGCIGTGLGIGVLVNPRTVVLVLAAVVFGVLYSRVLKSRGLSGNLVRGAPTALAFAFGMMMTADWPRWELLWLGLVFWLHDSASNLVGAMCDTDGDRRGGYSTFPVRHGDTRSLAVLALLTVLWWGLALTLPYLLGTEPATAHVVLLVGALVPSAVCLALLARAPRPIARPDALRAHEYFVFGRLLLAASVITLSGAVGTALALLLPSFAATAYFRAFMRRRDRALPGAVRTQAPDPPRVPEER